MTESKKNDLELYYNSRNCMIFGIQEVEKDSFGRNIVFVQMEGSSVRVSFESIKPEIRNSVPISNTKIKNLFKKVIKKEIEVKKLQQELRSLREDLFTISAQEFPCMRNLVEQINTHSIRCYSTGTEGTVSVSTAKFMGKHCSLVEKDYPYMDETLNISEDELYRRYAPTARNKSEFKSYKHLKLVNITPSYEIGDRESLVVYMNYEFSFNLTKKNYDAVKEELIQLVNLLK